MSATRTAGIEARRLGQSTVLKAVVRAGFVAYGVFHLAVAWLAFQIARGRGTEGDQSGAFRLLERQPGGKAILVIVIVGLIAMALWQGLITATGYSAAEGRARTGDRLLSAGRFIVYAALAYTAIKVAMDARMSSAGQQQRATAGILAHPAGQAFVAIVGMAVVAIGLGMVIYGGKRAFKKRLRLSEMGTHTRKLVVALATIGYVAKGIALGVAGGLIVSAAVADESSRSTGLDGALHTLAAKPYGGWLLGTIALGFAAHGIYCFWQSRYRKV